MCILISPISAFAQSIQIIQDPQFPRVGDRVTISLVGQGLDLQNSLVVWKENGEVVQEGPGLLTHTVTSAGSQNVVAEITDRSTGRKISQSINISTTQVDLLWEAVGSYTPPFYKGKALPPLEANINVVAIPKNNQQIESLVYNWEKESVSQPGQSGRGRNSFSYIATPLELANTISLNIVGLNPNTPIRESLVIRYGNAEVLFYAVDPILGTLFNRALRNGHEVGESGEITIEAIPFFATTEKITDRALSMIWSVNGSSLPVQTIKNRIRLSNTSGLSGKIIPSIFIQNNTRLFEEGRVGIELQF